MIRYLWSWTKAITQSLENIGQGVESFPGFQQLKLFLDEVLDAVVFGIALMWALRWYFAVCVVSLVLVGRSW